MFNIYFLIGVDTGIIFMIYGIFDIRFLICFHIFHCLGSRAGVILQTGSLWRHDGHDVHHHGDVLHALLHGVRHNVFVSLWRGRDALDGVGALHDARYGVGALRDARSKEVCRCSLKGRNSDYRSVGSEVVGDPQSMLWENSEKIWKCDKYENNEY